MAAFLRDSMVRRIVTLAELQLLVPEFIFEELEKHLPELAERAGLDRAGSQKLIERLRQNFTIVPPELVDTKMGDALPLMAGIDARDAAYLAAALCVPCDGIWSDDPHLKRQSAVRCYNTGELIGALRKAGFRG